MKRVFLIALLLSFQAVFAQTPEEGEVVLDSTPEEEQKLTIKEVKALIKTMPQDKTCMDEYLKRRGQLITKLALTPVTGAATIVASTYAGGLVAVALAGANGASGWAGLGYLVGGGAFGTIGSVAYVAYDTTKGAITLADNNLILKTLAEQYLDREGVKSEKLYKKYLKKTDGAALTKAEFLNKLMEMDASGKLCDGSLVKQPRVRIGSKLKFKIAKSKEIRKFLNAENVN